MTTENFARYCYRVIALWMSVSFVSTGSWAWDPVGDIKNPGRIIQNIEREARNTGRIIDRGRLELNAQAGAPVVMNWIIASRNNALNAGTQPIPTNIYQELRGFFPDDVLRAVRYRVGEGHFLSLQKSSFHLADRAAIALDNVIVFRHNGDAQHNVRLWAHEIAHVQQYRAWGIRDFAIRYLRSWNSVENDATRVENAYIDWRQRRHVRAPPLQASTSFGRRCGTHFGWCPVSPMPSGAECTCRTQFGRIDLGRVF